MSAETLTHIVNGYDPRGDRPVHPLIALGFGLSAAGAVAGHAAHDWLGYAAFLTAAAGLVISFSTALMNFLNWWGKRYPPKRRH